MIISRNLDAMNLNRIVNSNISAHAKSSEKVSSGYKINLAAGNPVGLAMSETMRRQIRGLMQGTNNAKDGVAFLQIADGAMSEIHDMLQRMNELSLKSADGLCTISDRAALNAEFDQLRTEIDRINSNTSFNEQPVFEEHEPSYYQICGNRQWNDNQLHTITESTNELNIHLPDGYVPKDYTITVPAGTYTTQELIDEIDDALHKMSPANPGFVFEYTSNGYCNLNFENADGKPTMIDFIDGSLAYLIYDFKTGVSSATLLGTTGFGPGETLPISRGNNDVLGFYAESEGVSQYIEITLEPKAYTYDDMFNALKSKLNEAAKKDDTSLAADIKVETYEANGKKFIQLTSEEDVSITGLKGNMFRYEVSGNSYHSVFYDNTIYGECTKTAASITGNPYDDKYPIIITNNNNSLKFRVNGSQDITINFDSGSYSVSKIVSDINEKLKDLGVDGEVVASGSTSLTLTSKLTGPESSLDFQSFFNTENPDIYKNTYDTLFCFTSGEATVKPGQPLSLTGAAALNGKISLSDKPLIFYVDDDKYEFTNIKDDYDDLKTLLEKLNAIADDKGINDKIKFVSYNGCLQIISISSDVSSITIDEADKNDTYQKLFTEERTNSVEGSVSSQGGGAYSNSPQGNLGITNEPALATASYCKQNINIDSTNNIITISLTHNSQNIENIEIHLNNGSYSLGQLAAEIKKHSAIQANNIQVSCSGDNITFIYAKPVNTIITDGDRWSIAASGSAWDAILRKETKTEPVEHETTPENKATLTSFSGIPDNIIIDSNNNTLNLELDMYGTKISGKIIIPENILDDADTTNDSYTRQTLLDALKEQISQCNELKDIGITVSYDSSNRLVFTAPGGTLQEGCATGNFYSEVMCRAEGAKKEPSNGSSELAPIPRIIGRADLTKESIEIIKGTNDQLTFDFTYPGSKEPLVMTITLPAGEYKDGIALFGDKDQPNQNLINDIERQIAEYDKNDPYYEEIQKLFGKDGCFDLNFSIGAPEGENNTNAANSVDASALQIYATLRDGADVSELSAGQYILDGVRGSAAPFVFYKTTSLPTASYIIGTKNVMNGVTIETGKNVLTLSVNDVPYRYTFPEDTYYTADELIDWLNDKFENGDDSGNPAPLEASLENGAVKISHKLLGANKITNVGGSARSTIFFEEDGRDSRDPLVLQVGAEQRSTIELPRISVSSCSLGINSLTLSQMKYADKAIERIKEAIHKLNAKRSTYGAMQNRLEHTINNNENVTEKVQETESGIRDTDIATEMIRYSNLSVLLQAGQNMIAQSNQRIEKLLTILQ
ncbi:MAG: hypothetical protein NC313_04900 [Butyrivibrio sp.]|nr:hypothetical protein [Butyrivibrio sp.]